MQVLSSDWPGCHQGNLALLDVSEFDTVDVLEIT
jgi:hypothetical protein